MSANGTLTLAVSFVQTARSEVLDPQTEQGVRRQARVSRSKDDEEMPLCERPEDRPVVLVTDGIIVGADQQSRCQDRTDGF